MQTSTDRNAKMSRERILEGASAILDSGRYADLTVDALARSLHMSKSTLYKYFLSKEDVVVALVRDACDRAEEEVERTLSGGSASERLADLAKVLGRHGRRLPRAVATEPERLPAACHERLRQTREAFSRAALALADQGATAGEFLFPDPRLVAVAFVASAEALLVDSARSGRSDSDATLELLPRLLLPGLRGGGR